MFNEFLTTISDFMYTYLLIIILIAAGLYFFVRTKGLPVRLLAESIRVVKEAPHDAASISSFRALMVSTASRVGIGNIAGVATAIAIGGAGSIFWMWVIAILGAASAFVESTLAQIYKRRSADGHSYGGPAYYIEQALRLPWLGYVFGLALILTYVGGFNLVASYTMNETLTSYGWYKAHWLPASMPSNEVWLPYAFGVILAILVGLSIFGGIKRLSAVTAVLVPIMAIGYVALCLVIIVLNVAHLPEVFGAIFKAAFDFPAIFGGFTGSAMMYGIKRGLYSNEAGVGSAPNAAATASVSHPVKQGLVQMLSVWIDTMVICTATALAVLSTSVAGGDDLKGAPFVQAAWDSVFGPIGHNLITVALFLFAFTTLIGNYSYAELNLSVVLRREPKAWEMTLFRVVCCFIVFYGAIAEFEVAWNLADILMGIMVLINIPAIIALGGRAFRALSDYQAQRKQGVDPVYNAAANGITEDVDFWK